MRLNNLPPELIQAILWSIPRSSLKPVSLVCKTWWSILLPLLYRSIFFTECYTSDDSAYLDNFLKRFIGGYGEHNHNPAIHVRDICYERIMDEEQLEMFGSAVSEMKNLEKISWWVSECRQVDWYGTLVLLYRKLPNLQSIHLTMSGSEIELGDLDEVIPFSNLRELTINFVGLLDEDPYTEIDNTHIELVRGARNIGSLCLSFVGEDDGDESSQYAHSVFPKLVQDHFPNLRKLDVYSAHLVPIDSFSGPSLREFIQNHTQLQRVVFHTDCYDGGCDSYSWEPSSHIIPGNVEDIMPSVKHFGGPGLLVGAVLSSKLAQQLEVLEFYEPPAEGLGTLSKLLLTLDSVSQLPRLKGLKVRMCERNRDDWSNALVMLENLAPRMPLLEELALWLAEGLGDDEDEELLVRSLYLNYRNPR
ncbi:unnamed protein product [Rhizoctonia solani]|uniref:F-box domain-containing protein n=1 Tax=Rhizoctonia solani TaxID=456999 RepID=A0A8H3CDN9_9AGAM|nr:unnamed protein product [Rhizoctonia solani]